MFQSKGSFVMQSVKRFGLSCALALPLKDHFNIDYVRLKTHARRCLEAGCSSVTVFGTTGEGASVSLAEREKILDALSAAGINLRHQVLGGVAAASVGDAVEQARVLIDRDCRGLLLVPPFYFKNVTDEGLYGWFSQLFETIGQRAQDIILYHIPCVTEVALSVSLISRLKAAFPNMVKGVKDSGSDWAYTESLLRAHNDLLILIGNERHLASGVRLGAQGAISGLANLCPEILLKLIETGEENPQMVALVVEILKFPFTPAVKALLAHCQKDPAWLNVRPPLKALSEAEAARLTQAYDGIVT
jgi:4-hydroxy-tetrahydrodipicolinate synthase